MGDLLDKNKDTATLKLEGGPPSDWRVASRRRTPKVRRWPCASRPWEPNSHACRQAPDWDWEGCRHAHWRVNFGIPVGELPHPTGSTSPARSELTGSGPLVHGGGQRVQARRNRAMHGITSSRGRRLQWGGRGTIKRNELTHDGLTQGYSIKSELLSHGRLDTVDTEGVMAICTVGDHRPSRSERLQGGPDRDQTRPNKSLCLAHGQSPPHAASAIGLGEGHAPRSSPRQAEGAHRQMSTMTVRGLPAARNSSALEEQHFRTRCAWHLPRLPCIIEPSA